MCSYTQSHQADPIFEFEAQKNEASKLVIAIGSYSLNLLQT